MFIGQTVSHYRVIEKIGRGGLAEVFLAEDTILGRHVALKFLTAPENSLKRKQILAEARSAASIDHPYACKVYETDEWNGHPFIVMEFLEGDTLAQRIATGPIAVPQAVKFASEIAEALAEAHDHQIVHCDLKPANVMITRSGHVKLMDFGLARSIARQISTSDSTTGDIAAGVAGTPAYMSPEQARGEDVDLRADVFSFGIMLFEMLTGVHPYRKNTAVETIAAILYESPPRIEQFVPAIPRQLSLILQKSLAPNPVDRYVSARVLWSDLVRVETGGNISGPRPAPMAAIAILPFADYSPERNQEYFCDGLADELITALGTLEQLQVASRTATFRYKNADISLADVGRALNVTSILEGSVRKAGDRLRITVKLVDIETGFPIWSERYERELRDIFDIQDDISKAVVEKLRVTLNPDARALVPRETRNVRAYEFYLRGRHFWNKRTEENLRLSIEQFERALAEDPDYALAYVGLADAHVTLGLYGAFPAVNVMPQAREAAERALQIRSDSFEALTSRACVHAIFEWQWQTSADEFERAIRLNPRYALARQWYAINCLAPRGQFARAKEELLQAAELDPVSLPIATSLGVVYFFERDHSRAISQLRSVTDLDDSFGIAHYFLGQVYADQGRKEDAIRELERAVELTGRSSESVAMLAHALAMAGYSEKAGELRQELSLRSSHRYVSPVLLAQCDIGLGNLDSAITQLEEARRLRSTDLIWLNVRPAFEALNSEKLAPRLQSIRQEVFG